jgi:drug/metabolite transporter (DMT)-like permease
VFGSLIGFTAFAYALNELPASTVGTYAYVNPVVAVVIGYFLGGETLGLRTILGTVFVLVSVVVMTTTPVRKPAAALALEREGVTSG